MTDKFTSHLGQKFRGGYYPRTRSNSSQALFSSPRSVTFISSFAGRPRIFSYPRTGYWAWPFLTQVVHMRLDIGPGLLQCSLNTGYQLAPIVIKLASNWNKIFRNISITNISTYLGSCSLSIVNDILQNTRLKSISLVVNFWNNYSKPT